MPPKSGNCGTGHVSQNVQRVTNRLHEMRANEFEKHGPDGQMENDFTGGGNAFLIAQTQPLLKLKKDRQRAGYQQHVVEMTPHKCAVRVGLYDPAIERVQAATAQAKRVLPE